MGEASDLWALSPQIALALWTSLPSGNLEITILRQALGSLMDLGPPQFCISVGLKVLPLHRFKPPLPIGCVYVGAGCSNFGVKPSAWLNPYDFVGGGVPPVDAYLRLAKMRPDIGSWLSPLGRASALICDCTGDGCKCHAKALLKLLINFGQNKNAIAFKRKAYEESPRVAGNEEPANVEEEEDVSSFEINETVRGLRVQTSVGYPTKWHSVIEEVRNAGRRIFWEIFAGCAILTSMFLECGWCCGPPIDVLFDSSFNLLNPAFVGLILGLIFEGRVALLHVGPPCSSFSWAVNKWPSHAMRSLEFPEGFWNLNEKKSTKVRLGNALAEVSLRLCKAQEKVHGFWQWEQPKECLMFEIKDIAGFVWRVGVYLAEVFVCAFGAPWQKPTWVFANFSEIVNLSRTCPDFEHEHISLQGFAPCGRNWTAVAGPYWPAFARRWAETWNGALSMSNVKASTHLSGMQMYNNETSLVERLQQQGFEPSGKRSCNVVAQRIAAGNQPVRRAVPMLLPEGLGPENHLSLALKLVHPFELPVSLPEHCKYACEKRVEVGEKLEELRTGAINLVEALARACLPTNACVMKFSHELLKPVLKNRNLALMRELSWITGFSDRAFLIDYVLGMDTLFWADPAPRFIPRLMEPLYPKEIFWDDVEEHNAKIMARVKSCGDTDLDKASWEKTEMEFKDGTLKGPYFCIDEVKRKYGRVRLLPRFPIWEQHGGAGVPTCRNIHNGLQGEQNNFCGNLWTNRPADLDLYIGLLRYVLTLFPFCALLGFTSDFKSAYRQCIANPEHAVGWVLTIWCHAQNCQVYGIAGAQLFGCSLAPTNFCRIPDWCCFVASRLFFLALIHCIDDIMTAEPKDTCQLGYRVWRRFVDACGWDIPDSKSPPPSAVFRLLGAMIDLSKTPLPPVIRLAEDRYEKLYKCIFQILQEKRLASGLAGQLFGQLGFSCSQFFGRWGRAKMRPLSRRQHEAKRFALNDQLWSALNWWLQNLHLAPPRAVYVRNENRPVVVSYSDGEGADAGVGIAAWCNNRLGSVPIAGFIEVPIEIRGLWSRQRKSYQEDNEFNDITEIEAIGPLLILHNWPWLVRDALWIHFIDNNGALGALVKGSASVHEQDLIIGATWSCIASVRALAWFDRVDSASNPVDGLSRKDFSGVWQWRDIAFPTSLLNQLRRSVVD